MMSCSWTVGSDIGHHSYISAADCSAWNILSAEYLRPRTSSHGSHIGYYRTDPVFGWTPCVHHANGRVCGTGAAPKASSCVCAVRGLHFGNISDICGGTMI